MIRYRLYGRPGSIKALGDKLVTLLAVVLILVPVVVLHFVTNQDMRVLWIVAFTLVFAAALSVPDDAKYSEIFAAAAAFVAVQAVYIGGGGSSGNAAATT